MRFLNADEIAKGLSPEDDVRRRYERMGIRVTPQMTLAPEPKKRVRKAKAAMQ
jgi:hypothetical protein